LRVSEGMCFVSLFIPSHAFIPSTSVGLIGGLDVEMWQFRTLK